MSIQFLNGDVLQDSDEKRVIVHVVNNKGGFGRGIAKSIAEKYPQIRQQYKNWYNNFREFAGATGGGSGLRIERTKIFKLGNIQIVEVDENLSIINMLTQNGYMSEKNHVPIKYEALKECLYRVYDYVDDNPCSIWMPHLIGCGLAGGDRDKVLEIIDLTIGQKEVKIFKL